MADTVREKCAHPICTCLAREDNDYCSPYCEDAKDTTEIACNCGHIGCESSIAQVAMPSEVEPAA
jgi:hypothetical protein